jgi:phosphocarrier protein HPr
MSMMQTMVRNPSGLHARPAAQLSAFCKKYPNDIRLTCGDRTCNPKSMFSLLGGCFKAGDTVTVSVENDDTGSTAQQIVSFIAGLEE